MKPIISKNIRVRYPKHFSVGQNTVIDDFSYFSAKIIIGRHCHIASGVSIAGGITYQFSLGDYSSISSGVKVWCESNDYANDLVILHPKESIGDNPVAGDVIIGNMCGIGANSVIMPNNNIPEGTVIGALSFVPARFTFKPWSVYAGIPIKFIKKRNKKRILAQVKKITK